jgi:uncharacterized protein (DUF697 family)
MTEVQKSKCQTIIHGAASGAAAVGAGLAQVPGSDSAVIVPIQAGMIIAVGEVFDKKVTESMAKGDVWRDSSCSAALRTRAPADCS